MAFEQLALHNQLCFPIYAASRLITREYKPLLDELGLTYPQYLVLLVLWQEENHPGLTVNAISEHLLLNTNTVTPLLKRMEENGLLLRQRSSEDERQVIVTLTDAGLALREKAATIPETIVNSLQADSMSEDDLKTMVSHLYTLIQHLNAKQSR